MDQLFLMALLFVALFVLSRRRIQWFAFFRANKWLMLLFGYMLVSVLWSELGFVSFKRWIREFEALVMALIVISDPRPRDAMEALLRRTIYIHIPLSMAMVKYLQDYGVQFNRWTGDIMWVGVSTQKNGLGVLCLLSAFFLFWTTLRSWREGNLTSTKTAKQRLYANGVVFVMTILLLKGPPGSYSSMSGYSSTSISALLMGVMVLLGLTWMKKRGNYMSVMTVRGLLILILLYGTSLPFSGGFSVTSFTSALGRDSTFTGRTDIWAELVPYVKDRPLLGCGFGGFWTPEMRVKHIISQAHNGYLEVLMEVGSAGLLLIAAFVLSSAGKAVRALGRDFDWASFCICSLLMFTLNNSTEASINTFTNFFTAVIMFVAMTVASTRNNQAKCDKNHDRRAAGMSQNAPRPASPEPVGNAEATT
jgi:O-antigen ligase